MMDRSDRISNSVPPDDSLRKSMLRDPLVQLKHVAGYWPARLALYCFDGIGVANLYYSPALEAGFQCGLPMELLRECVKALKFDPLRDQVRSACPIRGYHAVVIAMYSRDKATECMPLVSAEEKLQAFFCRELPNLDTVESQSFVEYWEHWLSNPSWIEDLNGKCLMPEPAWARSLQCTDEKFQREFKDEILPNMPLRFLRNSDSPNDAISYTTTTFVSCSASTLMAATRPSFRD